MANHWYFGNNTKKEYIECPYDCPTKQYELANKENCIFYLLARLCTDKWYENSITLYLDYPWHPWVNENHAEWKNITGDALKEYRQCVDSTLDIIHDKQLKLRELKERFKNI